MKSWHCNACRKEWKSEDTVLVFYHSCTASRGARRGMIPHFEGTTPEELWAHAFASLGGGTPAPPTAEEARQETGQWHSDNPLIDQDEDDR